MTRAHASPYQISRRSDDSPSRKVEYDLERAFSQVHLHHAECQRLDSFQRRQQQEELDAREMIQAEVHRKEINYATAQHELVRQQAEAVLRSYLKKEEEERRKLEEERRRQEEEEEKRRQEAEAARRRAELERREREERERLEREEREKAEKERLTILEKQKAEEEEKQRKEREATAQAQREESLRLEREQQEKQDRETALKQQQQQREADKTRAVTSVNASQAAPTIPGQKPTQSTSSTRHDLEAEHKHYLAIHQRLKTFRKDFWDNTRKNPALKPHVGDMRRAMKTSIGQLTDDRVGNRVPVC